MQQPASKKIKEYRRGYTIVGVTGHRDLLADDEGKLKELITQKLAEIRNLHPERKLLLVSPLAPGADLWAAQCLDDTKDELLIIEFFDEAATIQFNYNEGQEPGEGKPLFFQEQYNAFVDLGQKKHASKATLWNNKGQEMNNEKAIQQFVALGKFFAAHCDYLLALWDGIDGLGEGGTSDVVRMFVKGQTNEGVLIQRKKKEQHLFHLAVPRVKNHFPVGRHFNEELPSINDYQWIQSTAMIRTRSGWSKFISNTKKQWPFILSVFCVAALFSLLDVCKHYHLLNNGLPDTDAIKQQMTTGRPMNWWPIVVLITFYIILWIWYQWRKAGKNLFRQFIFPLAIIIFTLVTGAIGFYDAGLRPLSDAFFAAANLLTLGSSVFSSSLENSPGPVNLWLFNARITGAFFLAYAFILALMLTAGKEIFNQLGFRWSRFWKRKFVVVIGDGEMAATLVHDLARERFRLVFLYTGNNQAYEDNFNGKRVWFLKGPSTTRASLLKTYYWKAEEVYIFNNSDELNFRTIQEIDNMSVIKKPADRQQWYVHLANLRERALAQKISRKSINAFSIHENTARRLLYQFPIDRFNNDGLNRGHYSGRHARISTVVVLGFNELGKQIALASLRLGHYTDNKYNQVKVYYLPEEKNAVETFKAQHPELSRHAGPFGDSYSRKAIQDYTFFQQTNDIIGFFELPTAEASLIDPGFSLYKNIHPDFATSIYACFDTSLASASLLSILLPIIEMVKLDIEKLHERKQCDVQVFCYYNLPDKNEEEYVEIKLNTIATRIPVRCFGNMLQECSGQAIRNKSLDKLARYIAAQYAIIGHQQLSIDSDENFEEDTWNDLSEPERESNQHAADHAWIKLREMGLNLQTLKQSLNNLSADKLDQLIELEHRRWNAEKFLMGWLPYDNKELWTKNKNTIRADKYHLYLTTHDNLPQAEQQKDREQVKAVLNYLAQLYP